MQPNSSTSGAAAHGIRHLGPQWFAVVMGWSGLGLAWLKAQALLGPLATLPAYAAGVVAGIAFGLVLGASAIRLVRHRDAVISDLRHPVKHAFAAALPVSLMLLCTLAAGAGVEAFWVNRFWLLGVALEFLVTVWVIERWVREGLNWAAMTPVVFIPIVGNVVVALGAAAFDHTALGLAFLGIGAFAWPVVLALVLARTATVPIPDGLLPTWFISVAPPAVIGVAVLNLGGAPLVALGFFGIATCFLAVSISLLPRIVRGGFRMPLWGMSFPVAAYAALALRLAEDYSNLEWISACALALATFIIAGLSALTLRGLLQRKLLVPDPAPVVPAKEPDRN